MIKVSIIGKGKFGSKIESVIKDNVEFVEPINADWVIISTPNDLHYEQVEKWLSKRKNVFCEKPLTLTTDTADELFSLADFFNVKLYVDDVFFWHNNLDVNTSEDVDFKWYKYGSFNANIIDNLAYHHSYLWLGSEDFEVKDIYNQYYNSNGMLVTVTLEDGRTATYDYNILNKDYQHTINGCAVKSNNNPLQNMLLSVFAGKVNYEHNRNRTLNAIKLCELIKKEVLPKVLVVGGGIFGVTTAIMLSTSGYDVTLHEELGGIMKCASDINQYRLHRGYHYPRSRETIQECLGGLKPFKRKYEDSVVSRNINHYYAIAKSGSLVSVDEYLRVLDSMELNYEKVESFNGTDLTIKVDEELFDSEKLRNQSIQKMKGVGVNVILNRQTIKEDFDDYDYVVIATYSKINELLDEKRLYQFEVVEKPVVRLPDSYKNKSIVVMDGPFMCLDPYKDGLHVLGNVRHAIHSTNVGYKPIIRNKHLKEYLNSGVISNLKVTKIKKFIEDGMKFFEDFNELEHIGSMFTIRTVLANRDYDDARPTFVVKETDKVFSIFSGKIGTCVHAANQLVGELKG